MKWFNRLWYTAARSRTRFAGRTPAPVKVQPSLEQLESRDLPSVTIVDSATPTLLPTNNVHVGDQIKILVRNFDTTDTYQEIDEGESLVIQSSGGFRQTYPVDYQSHDFQTYPAVQDGETFSAYVLGADGDESATIEITTPGVDLMASINNITVHPASAPDLQLNEIFSGEELTVPVEVKNLGSDNASSDSLNISFYLSPTPTYDSSTAIPVASGNVTDAEINLDSFQSKTFNPTITIPQDDSLSRGDKVYVVAVISSDITETDANSSGNDLNNVAATHQVEYLGVPGQYFDADLYYNVVRDALQNTNPFTDQDPTLPALPTLTDGLHFTAAFESAGGYDHPNLAPYLDSSSAHHPTIGLGLNLDAITPAVEAVLAADVRAYYAAHANMAPYNQYDLSDYSDDDVVQLLKDQAGTGNAPQAFTTADAQAIFVMTYNEATTRAINFVGQTTWNNLSTSVRIAITDVAFNGIGSFNNLRTDLQSSPPDYILAGFDLLDSQRSGEQVQYSRSLADFEYLVFPHATDLGMISAN